MTSLVNSLRKQVDIPVWEWLRFSPVASTVPSATCAANNAQYNKIQGRYIYYLMNATNFWRYDTYTDTYEQLQTPPIAPATFADLEFQQSQGIESQVLGATSTTITIPAFSSMSMRNYDIKIVSGTGIGQRRIITTVAEPVIAETGVPTAVNNVLGALTITDSTKAWTVNQWAGYQVRISYGTGVGQVRRVLYNSATVLTLGDSTLSAQNIWCNPQITSPAIVATAGSQSIYVIESSVATVDTPWLITPDTTSQYKIESGCIMCVSSAAATPFYTVQYYDIASDLWYIKTANTLNVSAVGTDGTIDHAGFAASVWTRGNNPTSATNTTLTDTTQNWTVNQFAGNYIYFCGGLGEGQLSKIISNTNTVITFNSVTTAPDTTTNYIVEGYDCGTATSGTVQTITDSTKNWPINRYANFMVRILFGTGKGLNLQIDSNTANTITFVKPTGFTLDSTTIYSIIPDGDKSYFMLGGQAATFIYNYPDDLMTTGGRWHDAGIACNAQVTFAGWRPIGIASAAHVTTNATITTTVPHCLKVGMSVTVKGFVDSNYNTTATITSVPSTTQFTYIMAGTPAVDTLAGVQNTISLTDTTKNWTANQWAGFQCYMTTSAVTAASGLATGQVLQIQSNTATTLHFSMAGTAPTTGVSRYIITPRTTPGMMDNGLCIGTQSTTQLQDLTKASGLNASITSGSNVLTVNGVTFSASFANSQMTLTTAPVNGIITVGNLISGVGVPPNTIITSLASGTANTNGAVYNISTVFGNFAGTSSLSSGATASFATNVMTLVTVPTTGSVAIGQTVIAAGVAAGTTIATLASGLLNAASSTYTLSTTPGTISTEAVATTFAASAGGSASFATNVMTLTVAPTAGSMQVGQIVTAAGVAVGTTITALASGILNTIGSTYTLSTSPGTISAEVFATAFGTGTISSETVTAYPQGLIYQGDLITTLGSTGGQMSFATNIATLTTIPTAGSIAIGQTIQTAGAANGAVITGLLTGTLNLLNSTYSLSITPGTIAAQAITTTNITFATGGSASFATNQMTLTVAPTLGSMAIGMYIISTGVAQGTYITGLISGNLNAVSSVYSLSTSPGTITAQGFTAHNGSGALGCSASFATNVMTLTVAPTVGALAIGQVITAASVPAGTTITGLLSGTFNAVSSTYSLSTYPGTIGGAAITTSAIPVGAVITQQLTSTMPNGSFGGAGTYKLSLPVSMTLSNAQLSYMWVVNAFAGRKCKLIGGTGQSQEFSITSNTNTTLAMTAITTAPVSGSTTYAILQQPIRGTGVSLQGAFGLSDTNNSGKFWIVARGGAAVGFDKLDITTDTFYMMPTSPMTETLTTGSMYAYDGGDRLYFTKEATQRVYYMDLRSNHIHGAGMYPYAAPTATLGNRMEIFTTADGLNYLWINRQGFTENFRQLLFY